jgi:hypothetical protein
MITSKSFIENAVKTEGNPYSVVYPESAIQKPYFLGIEKRKGGLVKL